MSDRPTEFCFAHNPLRVKVETAPGSREFIIDHRARVEKLILGSNAIQSQATVRVFAGPIDTTPPGVEPGLDPGTVLSGGDREGFGWFLGPDQEIRIVRDIGDDEEVVFSGYCRNPRYDERGGQPSDRGFTLIVRSMLETLSMEPPCQISGRWMRSAAAQDLLDEEQNRGDELVHGDDGSAQLNESLDCIFNAGGIGNRAAAPVAVTINEVERRVHLFTADRDPHAKMWTFAQALRYLLCFHMEECEWWGFREVFDATDAFAEMNAGQRPSPPVGEAEAMLFAMLGEPRDLNVSGTNLPEALIVLADAAQVRFTMRTNPDGSAVPGSHLEFVARGCGTEKTLAKQAILDTRGLSPAEILEQNTVKDLSLQAVYEDVVTRPIFLGDVERFEVTVELVPGWFPDSNLDDVADVESAREYAEEHWGLDDESLVNDPWFRRYHKAGSLHRNYADIGRRWVLNETGRYYEAAYERQTGPFVASAYVPWEPSRASIKEYHSGTGQDELVGSRSWTRSPRPLQRCFSADRHQRSLGIYVEFSFDSGATWRHIPECRIMNLDDEAGIYIDSDDLTTLVMPGDEPKDVEAVHFWGAFLSNAVRLRVTGVIDGDRRVHPELDSDGVNPVILFATSRVFDVSARYKSNRRDAANSIFGPNGVMATAYQTVDVANDWDKIQKMATGVLDLLAGRQHVFAAVIPWLTTDYRVLDTIDEVYGMGIDLTTHGPGRQPRRTDIVAIEYIGSHTRLVFEDPRMLTQLEV